MTNDVRKPPHVWVDNKIELILKGIFNMRRKVEKTMSRRELIAYDKMLAQVLNKETIINRLRSEMDSDSIGLN
jgi:hypothetical protein